MPRMNILFNPQLFNPLKSLIQFQYFLRSSSIVVFLQTHFRYRRPGRIIILTSWETPCYCHTCCCTYVHICVFLFKVTPLFAFSYRYESYHHLSFFLSFRRPCWVLLNIFYRKEIPISRGKKRIWRHGRVSVNARSSRMSYSSLSPMIPGVNSIEKKAFLEFTFYYLIFEIQYFSPLIRKINGNPVAR